MSEQRPSSYIDDPLKAEVMAYAEKPLRDESKRLRAIGNERDDELENFGENETENVTYRAVDGFFEESDRLLEVANTAGEREGNIYDLASTLHEEWRKTRLNPDGTYEPRIKSTSDQAWIDSRGGVAEVDIANTSFGELPADWQEENTIASAIVIDELAKYDLSEVSDDVVEQISSTVHDKWLERNGWAKGGELDVPYIELPETEKAKDRDQVLAGLAQSIEE